LLALALVLGVIGVHLAVGRFFAQDIEGWLLAEAMPERLKAAFTRELKAADPVAVVRAAPPAAPAVAAAPVIEPAASAPPTDAQARRKPKPRPKPKPVPAIDAPGAESMPDGAEAAASAPRAQEPRPAVGEASGDVPSASQIAQADPEVPALPVAAASAPPAPAAPASAADAASALAATPGAPGAAGTPFEWPASTQIRYVLKGWYQGEVQGSAQVEWVRQGMRYQVHLDVFIGPSFAPLMSRRMTSDGVLGDNGLQPLRYDEETRVGLGQPRRLSIHFEPDAVVLPNGRRYERTQAVQDAASQFVQLTWMFTLQPELLRQGGTVDVMLALPRRVDRWVFDVVGEETLNAPFGTVETVHIRPRRVARPGSDRTAEVWVAPRLQYLPVRIRIRQDEETYVDLMIDRPPLQSAK
jgi:hypothetical protein